MGRGDGGVADGGLKQMAQRILGPDEDHTCAGGKTEDRDCPGDAAKSWGANVTGSPVLATNDPEERVTIQMVPVGAWSAGPMAH
jgi:hypothetical protein